MLKLNTLWGFIALTTIAALLVLGGCVLDATPTVQHKPPETPTTTPTVSHTQPIPSPTPEYDRDEWGGWIDADGDCQNTRAEVLIEESLVEPVLDGCRVVAGRWLGPWSGLSFEDAAELDIDHHVPLAHAHRTGGSAWDPELKRQFSNDLENLNTMSSSLNRSKGSRGPDEWLPPDETSHCAYAVQWKAVKAKYRLSIAASERQVLDEVLASCGNGSPPPTPPSRYLPVEPSVTPSPSQIATERVYESCEMAENAGEKRVQGDVGNGWGFPRAMVPSKRDGDNDGVVCEE